MRISDKQQLKPIQLQVALVPVCKIVIRLGVHFHEFVRNIQKAYIHAAEEILTEQSISPNHQAIAVKTGMDRRTISEHKNNIKKSYAEPLNKMDMIIVQLQLLCIKRENKTLTINELKRVIDSVYANHIRSIAVIRELLTNNIITEIKDDEFKLNTLLSQQLQSIEHHAEDVDHTAKRLFKTFYRNLFSHRENITQRLSSQVSTRIKPEKHKKVNQLIADEMKICEERIRNIIKANESLVPDDTFPEIGMSHFQFDDN
jgi:hypothetical protein